MLNRKSIFSLLFLTGFFAFSTTVVGQTPELVDSREYTMTAKVDIGLQNLVNPKNQDDAEALQRYSNIIVQGLFAEENNSDRFRLDSKQDFVEQLVGEIKATLRRNFPSESELMLRIFLQTLQSATDKALRENQNDHWARNASFIIGPSVAFAWPILLYTSKGGWQAVKLPYRGVRYATRGVRKLKNRLTGPSKASRTQAKTDAEVKENPPQKNEPAQPDKKNDPSCRCRRSLMASVMHWGILAPIAAVGVGMTSFTYLNRFSSWHAVLRALLPAPSKDAPEGLIPFVDRLHRDKLENGKSQNEGEDSPSFGLH